MATRQYIGARYVPKFFGTWNSNTAYEPLSIVQDSNGNSYTSKTKVPAGTSLANTDYWLMTANLNGQIEQLNHLLETYREETDSSIETLRNETDSSIETLRNETDNSLDHINDSITGINSNITGINNNINDITARVARIRRVSGMNVIIVGDSYASGVGSTDARGWASYFTNTSGIKIIGYAYQNGGGFAALGNDNATYPNMNYANALSEIANGLTLAQRDSINFVIMQSGWNDCSTGRNPGGENAVNSGVKSAVNNARSYFRNALPVIIPSWNDTPIKSGTQYNILYNCLGNACKNNYCLTTTASPTWFYGETDLGAADGTHLSNTGYARMAAYIYAFLCGWDGVTTTYSRAATNVDGVSDTLYCIRKGNHAYVKGTLTVANFSFGQNLCNIPENCRPTTALYLPVMIYGGTGSRAIGMCRITAAGDLDIRDLGQTLASTTNIPIYFNLDYTIDYPR